MNRLRMMAIAAAAVAAMTGAPTAKPAYLQPAQYSWIGGRRYGGRRRRRGWNSKNEEARSSGIPKAFRQYCRRYHGTLV